MFDNKQFIKEFCVFNYAAPHSLKREIRDDFIIEFGDILNAKPHEKCGEYATKLVDNNIERIKSFWI